MLRTVPATIRLRITRRHRSVSLIDCLQHMLDGRRQAMHKATDIDSYRSR